MAELLVRIADKVNEDFYLNLQCTKRGDVIVVCPDGWPWGREEVNAPHWTIIKLPGVPVEEVEHLVSPEPQTDPHNPSKTLQRRMWKLDLDHPAAKGRIDKDTLLKTLASKKQPVKDPKVF